MPEKYIWVNLPAYYLKVWDADTLVMESKIICGKPATPTPLITSAITNMITYPTWTIPNSIIKKDILPGLQRSSNYLARKGYSLLNNKGEEIDPSTVNWSKYTKGIPYKVQQGSGDDKREAAGRFARTHATHLARRTGPANPRARPGSRARRSARDRDRLECARSSGAFAPHSRHA